MSTQDNHAVQASDESAIEKTTEATAGAPAAPAFRASEAASNVT